MDYMKRVLYVIFQKPEILCTNNPQTTHCTFIEMIKAVNENNQNKNKLRLSNSMGMLAHAKRNSVSVGYRGNSIQYVLGGQYAVCLEH